MEARERPRTALILLLAALGCAAKGHPAAVDAASPGPAADAAGGSAGSPTPVGTGGGGGESPVPTDAAGSPPDAAVGVDAGATDAVAGVDAAAPPPSTDGGVNIGGPSLPCKFQLCESFESATEGQPPDPAVWSASKAVVGTEHAARGSKALHVPPLLAGSILMRETKTFPALGKSFYTRIFLWVDRQPLEKPAGLYHWTTIEASDSPAGGGRVLRLGGHIDGSGTDWLRFNYNTHAGPGETGLSDMTAVLQPKRWYCLEAYFNMDDQEARFWMDGEERPMLHWKANQAAFAFPPEVKSLSFGWAEYQAPKTPFEIWIDEIAIDSQRIGCQD